MGTVEIGENRARKGIVAIGEMRAFLNPEEIVEIGVTVGTGGTEGTEGKKETQNRPESVG